MMSSLLRRIAGTVVALAGLAGPPAMAGDIAAFQFQPGTEALWPIRAEQNAASLAAGRSVLDILGGIPGMRPIVGMAESYSDNRALNDGRWDAVIAALGVQVPRHWRKPEFRSMAHLSRNELALRLEPLTPAGWGCPWELIVRTPLLMGAITIPAEDGAAIRLPEGVALRAEPVAAAPYAALYWQGKDGTLEEIEMLEVSFTGSLHLVVSDKPIRLGLVGRNVTTRGGAVFTNSPTQLTGQLSCTLTISPR